MTPTSAERIPTPSEREKRVSKWIPTTDHPKLAETKCLSLRVRGWFRTVCPPLFFIGSIYGPLQSDGWVYLCPDCGGYGSVPKGPCRLCGTTGEIFLHDARVVPALASPRARDV